VFLKEVKDTLKQIGFIMAFLAVMPLVYLLDSSLYKTGVTFTEYMLGGFALLWMIAVGYLAYNIFRPEEKDNAVEYVLSLPISRWKLLIWKVAPRAVVLLILIVIPLVTNDIPEVVAFVVFAQFCGFVLGIVGRRSWIARSMLFVMTICVFFINSTPPKFMWRQYFSYSSILSHSSPIMIFMEHVMFSQLSYFFIEFGLLALILLPLYRNWDLKPIRKRELSFAKRAIVPLIVLAFPVVWMVSS
jgi:ABC-type transport system involved in multi-copper enzyme maturation permease subunit